MGVAGAGLTSWIGFSLSACSGAGSNQVRKLAFAQRFLADKLLVADYDADCSQVQLSYITCWLKTEVR